MRFKSSNFTFFTQFSKQIQDINPLHEKEYVNLKLMMIGIRVPREVKSSLKISISLSQDLRENKFYGLLNNKYEELLNLIRKTKA